VYFEKSGGVGVAVWVSVEAKHSSQTEQIATGPSMGPEQIAHLLSRYIALLEPPPWSGQGDKVYFVHPVHLVHSVQENRQPG